MWEPDCGKIRSSPGTNFYYFGVDENGKITDAKFKTFGCGSAIASSSLATELIVGQHLDSAAKIKNQQIAKELSLPPVKLHCSMLAADAVQAAINDYKKKQMNLDVEEV
uniref:NIF system FeS cluster assembly NifU N-terminal domain-containing protein n=1 Tax=Meloidogyne incognita TaxID=6306 RepID=A0A914NJG0_MELIC